MDIQLLDVANEDWVQVLRKLQHDFYHLSEYVDLESKRIKSIPKAILISENDKIFFVPYLLRDCSNLFDGCLNTEEAFDAVSPYGYPGILLSEVATHSPEFINSAIEELKAVLCQENICSAYFRLHPILNERFEEFLPPGTCQIQGETIFINLELDSAEMWRQTRNGHRTEIKSCERLGMTAKIVPFKEYIDEFVEIYQETMIRVEASSSYFFDYHYFCGLSDLDKNIHLCIVEWEQQIVCVGLFSECNGIVQYHLSGTRNQFLKQAPTKLMLHYVREWAKERGNKIFHLGGGVGSTKDKLYDFKAGFSKDRCKYMTLRLISDEQRYRNLVELRAKYLNIPPETLFDSSFFPAYRASIN